jgi:hypothetical protein
VTRKRGRQAAPVDPRDKKIAEMERQIAKLAMRAKRAEAIAEVQIILARRFHRAASTRAQG